MKTNYQLLEIDDLIEIRFQHSLKSTNQNNFLIMLDSIDKTLSKPVLYYMMENYMVPSNEPKIYLGLVNQQDLKAVPERELYFITADKSNAHKFDEITSKNLWRKLREVGILGIQPRPYYEGEIEESSDDVMKAFMQPLADQFQKVRQNHQVSTNEIANYLSEPEPTENTTKLKTVYILQDRDPVTGADVFLKEFKVGNPNTIEVTYSQSEAMHFVDGAAIEAFKQKYHELFGYWMSSTDLVPVS